MKKGIAILLTVVMLLSCVGCVDKAPPDNSLASTGNFAISQPTSQPTTPLPEPSIPAEPDLVSLGEVPAVTQLAAEDHLDENGFVSLENASKLIDDVYEAIQDCENVTYSERHEFSVYMTLDNGIGYHYTAPVPGLANSGDGLAIYSYQPYYNSFINEMDYVINLSSLKHVDYPNQAIDALASLDITHTSAYILYDKDVTIESLKKMAGGGVILWVGHGGYSSKYHSTLLTYIEYNDNIRLKYKDDFDTHRLEVSGYHDGKKRVCLTSAFFDYYLAEGALENTIVYLGACHSGEDTVLVTSLLDKGASAVYCNTDAVFQAYNNKMCKTVVDALCSGATTTEALQQARNEHGVYDNVIWGVFNTQAQVVCYMQEGLTDITLQALYERITKSSEGESGQNPTQPPEPTPTEPIHNHSYTGRVAAPTCTQKGYTTYTCSCGDSYTGKETPATGHTWGDWENILAPTESKNGTAQRKCTNCTLTEQKVLEKLGYTKEKVTEIFDHIAWSNVYTNEHGWDLFINYRNEAYIESPKDILRFMLHYLDRELVEPYCIYASPGSEFIRSCAVPVDVAHEFAQIVFGQTFDFESVAVDGNVCLDVFYWGFGPISELYVCTDFVDKGNDRLEITVAREFNSNSGWKTEENHGTLIIQKLSSGIWQIVEYTRN